MQWLAAVCVRRPVFTWVLMLSLVVVGMASFFGLGVDRFPNIDFPVVVVVTRLPGASPEQIETEVSEPLEEAVNAISGVDELRSNSYEGLSVVTVRFDLAKNIDVAAGEVRDRVDRILATLPEGIDPPQVQKIDPAAVPIMQIAVRSTRSARELTEYADRRIRPRIESLNGVGGVSVLGGYEREIRVTVDPVRLESFGLTARDVQRALATENVELPGGEVDRGAQTLQLRVQGRVRDPRDFSNVPVATRAGRVVRVGDVAQVQDAEQEPSSAALLNGEAVVVLSVRKQSGSNTVAVVDALRERIAELETTLPPSYRVDIVRDESEFIRNAVSAVEEHLILGGLFAALVVLLFLWNGRSTIIAALAIPTSIIATFALVRAMGLTLNTITLLALTLSVGIVIDDAIVVLENIVRFIEEKRMSPRRAAILATKEIGLAVLATTLSLVAVFLPIAFMGGIVGRFMSSFGLTMSFAIMVSLLVSFTLTPMLSSRWLAGPVRPQRREGRDDEGGGALDDELPDPAPEARKDERARYAEWARGEVVLAAGHGGHGRGGLYGRLERAYLRVLAFSMRHRWVVGIAVVLVLASVVPIGKLVPKTFLPANDESRFEVTVRAPEGTSLEQGTLIAERIARQIRALAGVSHTVVTVGSPPGDASGRGTNQASIFVALVPAHERPKSQDTLIGEVRERILPRFASSNLRTIVSPLGGFGGGGAESATIQYVLSGPEIEQLERYSQRLLATLREVRGVVEADTTLVTGRPSLEVQIDRPRAADLGVSVSDVALALRLMVGGVEVTNYSEGSERFGVVLRAPADARSDANEIANVTVPTRGGGSVRLGDIAAIVPSTGPSSIQHLGRQRQVTIYSNVLPGTSESDITAALDRARDELDMEPGYTAALAGRSRELGRAGRGFGIAFGLSLIFMYLVLAAQFESWIHPITILISLPLTVPFALISLFALGQSLNIFSMLGLLVLFGIVKKNSILQVDHMRTLRREGLSRADAVMVGNRDRLRPILMTTVAFVAGMIPLVVSSGAGAGTNRAMGSAIIGGQSLSLLLTLLATPVVYSWLDDLSHARWLRWVGRALLWPVRKLDRLVSRGSSGAAEVVPLEALERVDAAADGSSAE
jgi:HAE1 family hydrophobic/amphiphilic exporter-1